jgi:4'-phosphopantetheinyl transferase
MKKVIHIDTEELFFKEIPDAHFYFFDLAEYQSNADNLSAYLAEDEIKRAGRYHFKKHREIFIKSRGILRRLLSEYAAVKPAELVFAYNDFGKPHIINRQNTENIRFNVSHAEEYFLIGITYGSEIGVDIETIRPIPELAGIVESLFHASEKEKFYLVNETSRIEAFYRWWTQKEAIGKAVGSGIGFGFNTYSLDFSQTHAALDIPPYSGMLSTHRIKDNLIFCSFILKGSAGGPGTRLGPAEKT